MKMAKNHICDRSVKFFIYLPSFKLRKT